MTKEQKDVLLEILIDIPTPYQCTRCKTVWVNSGCLCDCPYDKHGTQSVDLRAIVEAVKAVPVEA